MRAPDRPPQPLTLGSIDMDQMTLDEALVFLKFFPESKELKVYMTEAWPHAVPPKGWN